MGQKRVAAIHDISGFGKCSLTVCLPVISAAGIETAVIPTAVLSTHTGGFKDYTFTDLTYEILPIAQHWKSEGITFDTIYTGYLGSIEQVQIVCQVIDLLKSENTKVVVDPVMADNGKLYAGFSEDFPDEMLKLCKKADVIVPNITEACFLLGLPYEKPPYTRDFVSGILKSLKQKIGADIVLTGVGFNIVNLGAAILKGDKISFAFNKRNGALFHGTGDVFGSALVAALTKGEKLENAAQLAVDFTYASIMRTLSENPDRRYGVNFEGELPMIAEKLGKKYGR